HWRVTDESRHRCCGASTTGLLAVGLRLAEFRAQLLLVDFPGSRQWHGADLLDLVGDPPVSDLALQPGQYLVRLKRLPCARLDDENRTFTHWASGRPITATRATAG